VSAYQTLYRKYRSQTFADLVGQEAVSRALQGAIAGDRIAHAYLFSGSRGTGKTSTARLLAKAVNCFQRQSGSSEPCNVCESCLQITAGAALDLIEIDAASNRGIDEIRDLREKVHLAPALGKRKVYIIDEAHMLTTEAFNALLKTLEEPPAHVVFVLCTTESHKIPLTVLGRCLQFPFRRLTDEQVGSRLTYIAGQEGFEVEPAALAVIARTADGSMRDAVGLLDQLVPLASGRVTSEVAREVLGIADPALIAELFDLVQAGRPAEALAGLARAYEGGAELRQVVRGLMERCRDLLLEAIENGDEEERRRLSDALDALLHLDGEVRRHAEPRFLVEATLVRIAVAAPTAAPAAPAAAMPTAQSGSPPAPEAAGQPGTESAGPPAPGPTGNGPEPSTPAAVEPPAPAAAAAGGGPAVDGAWNTVLQALSAMQRAAFKEARPEVAGQTLILWFRYAAHQQLAQRDLALIQEPVAQAFGGRREIECRLQDVTIPAAPRPAAPEEDPLVQAAVRRLEGKVTRVREIRQ
jgi:DNA polymerase-3 subunit gamma/tau